MEKIQETLQQLLDRMCRLEDSNREFSMDNWGLVVENPSPDELEDASHPAGLAREDRSFDLTLLGDETFGSTQPNQHGVREVSETSEKDLLTPQRSWQHRSRSMESERRIDRSVSSHQLHAENSSVPSSAAGRLTSLQNVEEDERSRKPDDIRSNKERTSPLGRVATTQTDAIFNDQMANKTISQLQDQMMSLKVRLESVERSKDSLSSRVSESEEKVEHLKTALRDTHNQMTPIPQRLKSVERSNDSLSSRVSELEGNAEQFKNMLRDTQNQVEKYMRISQKEKLKPEAKRTGRSAVVQGNKLVSFCTCELCGKNCSTTIGLTNHMKYCIDRHMHPALSSSLASKKDFI